MTFTFVNPDLPDSVSVPFNRSAPVFTANMNESTAPLLIVDSFYKYGGVNPLVTELANPDATYNLYKITLPFLSVLSLKIEGFSSVNNVNQLTGQRFYLDDTVAYIASPTPPSAYQVTIEIPSPIPLIPCELTTVLPVGMAVDRTMYEGTPLNFAQTEQTLVIDCSESCCQIRGGELIQLTGIYTVTPDLINQIHDFNINQNLGLIDYVEWRGQRFVRYLRDSISGVFLWDSIAQSLKLIP